VTASLTRAGLEVSIREVPHDESIKTPEEVSAVHDWLLGIKFRRDDVFVIVGGGAVDSQGRRDALRSL